VTVLETDDWVATYINVYVVIVAKATTVDVVVVKVTTLPHFFSSLLTQDPRLTSLKFMISLIFTISDRLIRPKM